PVSDQIEAWLHADGPKTLGTLTDAFEEKSFAVVFVLLLGVPALPLPTGGVTHVFEVIAALLSLELIVGRDRVWLPERWRRVSLDGPSQQRFLHRLLRLIRRLERFSKPHWRWLFGHRVSSNVFGVLVLALSIGAFVAPPFSGLDTLPALGAVLIALAVLLEDVTVLLAGILVGAGGVALELVLGKAAFEGIKQLIS
ncbi:MAG TPA: exopolysaccharide biosynthesis protein, partial [Thermoleophilaceae bacterium]